MKKNNIAKVFVGIMVLISAPLAVWAYSASYTDIFTGTLRTVPTGTQSKLWQTVLSGSVCNYCHYGRLHINNPSISVQYGVQVVDAATGVVIPSGATVPQGTQVRLRFMPHESRDIYWFATGSFASSPYGDWITSQKLGTGATVDKVPSEVGASLESVCTEKNRIFSINGDSSVNYGSLSINAPVKNVDVGTGWNCTPVAATGGSPATAQIGNLNGGGYDCTLDHVGAFNPIFSFDSTQGHFYTIMTHDNVCGYGNLTTRGAAQGASNVVSFSIPAQSIGVTYEGSTYTLDIPAQTLGEEIESLTIPAQIAESGASYAGGLGGGFWSWVSSVVSTAGDSDGQGVAFPGGSLQINVMGSSIHVPAQTIGNFAITPATFYVNTSGGSSGISTVTVPRQTVPYTINVTEAEGNPPGSPTVNAAGAGRCVVGEPYTIRMNATDPEGDQIRYGVDWDADGSIDVYVPGSGYVESGIEQSATRVFSESGSHTVRVFAQDEDGFTSAYTSFSFVCGGDADDETISVLDGPINGDPDGDGTGDGNGSIDLQIRTIPSLVSRGATTQVNWSAENVESCTVTAPNGDSWTGIHSPVGGETSAPIQARTVYTLTCETAGGTRTRNAAVDILPTWREF